jgi:hypothetical protein
MMATKSRWAHWRVAGLALVIMLCAVVAVLAASCGSGGTRAGSGSSGGSTSGNLQGGIGSEVAVGGAVITVKSFEAAFQPVSPAQKLSDEALVAPAAGVTFYQAYVRIENRGQAPLRVDPEDFLCRIGNTLSMLEPTRSGPAARSIIFGTSIDLVLTFRGVAGAEPTLVYNPTWYSGLISFSAGTATQGTVANQTTTTGSSAQLGTVTTLSGTITTTTTVGQ